MKNWKTTLAGILMILVWGAVKLGYITTDIATALSAILTGLGLVAAQDGTPPSPSV